MGLFATGLGDASKEMIRTPPVFGTLDSSSESAWPFLGLLLEKGSQKTWGGGVGGLPSLGANPFRRSCSKLPIPNGG